MDPDRVAVLLETQGALLREVRDDVKDLNANMSQVLAWRNSHVRTHNSEERKREQWQGRLWALVAPYVVGAIVVMGWLVAKGLGLV